MDDTTLVPAAELAARNTSRKPNESAEYRAARQALLIEEYELRRQLQRVADLRSALPPGGEVEKTYRFIGESGPVTMAEMFEGHQSLVIYSAMYGPQRKNPCPMCTSMIGSFSSKVADIKQRVGFAIVARSPIERLVAWKQSRGWHDIPVYSDESGDYTRDYVSAEDADMPAYNVFTRSDGALRHFWSEEIGEADPGQDPRGAIEMDALWLVLDSTPEGRGTDWHPKLSY
jgi:predicted dithiol-disulfide oxidoreductase (DUF899 family)